MENDWLRWHQGYDKLTDQALRLGSVQNLIRIALDNAPPGQIRIVSMCAGDGRDLLGVLDTHPRGKDVEARLVEFEPDLIERGRAAATRLGLPRVTFLQADAAESPAYLGAVPARLVLVCGVFGNISNDDVRRTVFGLKQLCERDSIAIWTRGRWAPDLVPDIRRWFSEAAFEELTYIEVPNSTATVAAHRFRGEPAPLTWTGKLFSFLPPNQRPSKISNP
ncbi:MAG: class I SAM-dependent methyltransferase family protein [Thermoplasmata archaeon]